MNRLARSACAGTLFAAFFLGTALPALAQPAEPLNQVHGFYSKGTMKAASSMPQEGKGLLHIFHNRKRFYGSDGLIEIIESAAAEMSIRHPGLDRLQVGDIAAEQGGFISGHASHQNGLDADIVYYRMNHQEQNDPNGLKGFEESFVVKGKVTSNFDVARNWELVKLFEQSGRLNRIFVDEKIKEALCFHALSIGEIKSHEDALKKLRPYANHDDHLHVRITCPATSAKCEKQDPVLEATSGCFQSQKNDDTNIDLVQNEARFFD